MASQALTLRWTRRAVKNLESLELYVAEQNSGAAAALVDRILEAAGKLSMFPRLGRIGRVAGSREMVLSGTAIIIAYQINGEYIEILAVLHAARLWPHAFPGQPTLH